MIDDVRGMLQAVSSLPIAEPDARRSAETRERCAALLAKKHEAALSRAQRAATSRRLLMPVLVGGFCVLYLSLVAVVAFGRLLLSP